MFACRGALLFILIPRILAKVACGDSTGAFAGMPKKNIQRQRSMRIFGMRSRKHSWSTMVAMSQKLESLERWWDVRLSMGIQFTHTKAIISIAFVFRGNQRTMIYPTPVLWDAVSGGTSSRYYDFDF
jgi:hypothetical protein